MGYRLPQSILGDSSDLPWSPNQRLFISQPQVTTTNLLLYITFQRITDYTTKQMHTAL